MDMVKKDLVTINVSLDTWQMLKSRKQRPGQTFEEIIRNALLEMEERK